VIVPKIDLYTEAGIHLFAAHDVKSEWRRQPRPVGRHQSTAWLPGNFLSEGNLLVHASLVTHTPATVLHVQEPNVVTFQVVDHQHKDSARGDYVGPIPGIIRPMLIWTTGVHDK
jgi:lipopolysaccharide transport system ATP-binding protein